MKAAYATSATSGEALCASLIRSWLAGTKPRVSPPTGGGTPGCPKAASRGMVTGAAEITSSPQTWLQAHSTGRPATAAPGPDEQCHHCAQHL
jgi:hypothetical protein